LRSCDADWGSVLHEGCKNSHGARTGQHGDGKRQCELQVQIC